MRGKTPSSLCIYAHGQLVTRLNANTTAITTPSPGTTIKTCP